MYRCKNNQLNIFSHKQNRIKCVSHDKRVVFILHKVIVYVTNNYW